MSGIRRWHWLLIPIPILGWLLLAAIWLDARETGARGPGARHVGSHESDENERTPPAGSAQALPPRELRLTAAAIDLALAALLYSLPPPTLGWLLASCYLAFRDGGARPISLGKRLVGLRVVGPGDQPASYLESFGRNLPLLLPYLGPCLEGVLLLVGRRRLGDRLTTTRVLAPNG